MDFLIFENVTFNKKYVIGYKVVKKEVDNKDVYYVRIYTAGGKYTGETNLGGFSTHEEALKYKKEIDAKVIVEDN